MANSEVDARPEINEDDTVEAWRIEQLLTDGFSLRQATKMLRRGVDYHDAERLLKMGRPHDWIVEYLT